MPTFRPSLFHQFEYLEFICIDSTSWGICVWNSSTLQQSSYWTTRLPLSTLETPWSILSTELQYHHCLPLPLSCPVRPLSPLPCFFPVDCCFFKFLCKDTRLKDRIHKNGKNMPWVNDTRFNTQQLDSWRGWRGMSSTVLIIESEVEVEELCGKKESLKSVFSNPVGMHKWAGSSKGISVSASSTPLFLPLIPSILVIVELEDVAFNILTYYCCHQSHRSNSNDSCHMS